MTEQLTNFVQLRVPLEHREWHVLRNSPDHQILLTLDYFKLHFDKLAGLEAQDYFEANLFQPNLLLQQLSQERSPCLFDKFDQFIKQSLKFYAKNGELSRDSLFFIRMAYMVNAYAAELNPELFGNRLKSFIQQIQGWIEVTTDSSILASLYPYTVLAGSTGLLDMDQPEIYHKGLLAHLKSNLWIITNESLDCDTRFRRKILHRKFEEELYENQDLVNPEMILSLLRALNIDTASLSVTGNFPIYEMVANNKQIQYTIDVAAGLLFDKTGNAYTQTPEIILTNPIWNLMGLTPPKQCFITPNQTIVEYQQAGLHLRFIQKERYLYDIQMNWNNEGWHQMCPFSIKQAVYLSIIDRDPKEQQLLNLLSVNLPEILKERDMLAWVSEDKKAIKLISKGGQVTYRMQNENKTGHYRTKVEGLNNTMLCEKPKDILKPINAIEDPQFITVFSQDTTSKKNQGPFTVNLPRYGLTFSKASSQSPMRFQYQHRPYSLDANAPSLGNGIAHAFFKSDVESICILPIQRFISTGVRAEDSEYYQLTQDTAAAIRKINDASALQYSNTERFIVLKIRDGNPIPNTPAEAMYLVYLYLGSNQPKKAWEMLEYCQKQLGGLKGDKDETLYLQWILNELPYHNADEEREINNGSKAIITNPKYVAIKLKTLSFYTCYFSNHETGSTQTTKELATAINHYYTQLQKMRRDLPVRYQLDEEETYSLLNFYHQKFRDKPIGSLGYEWVQLRINVLKQELDILTIKESQTTLTNHERKRKAEIMYFVLGHQGVAKLESKLITPSIFDTGVTNCQFLTVSRDDIMRAIEKHETPPEVYLSLDCDVLIKNFAKYFAMAMLRTPLGGFRKLKKYCETIKIGSQYELIDSPSEKKYQIASILYLVCCGEIKKLPENAKTIQDIVAYLRTIPKEPIFISQYVEATDELLIAPEAILQNIPHLAKPIRPSCLKKDAGIPSILQRLSALQLTVNEWRQLETEFSKAGETQNTPTKIGINKYDAKQQLKNIANKAFSERTMQTTLEVDINAIQVEMRNAQVPLVESILTLGNQGSGDPRLQTELDIDRAAKKQKPLDLNALLSLYFNQDILQYQKKTGLNADQAQQLHQQLCLYVANQLQLQQCNRVLDRFAQLKEAKTDVVKEEALLLLAQALFAENHSDVLDDPVLSLFQLHSDILLRLDQKEAINRLLRTADGKYLETVEKIIMGAGKTKVLLPTLTHKKANGSNLVMVEVPKALLDTNYADLCASSDQFFQQKAHLFQFNRDTDCSEKHFQVLYEKFIKVIVGKGYLVTTGDALQSLELKYLELLNLPQKNRNKQWTKQIYWADKLVSLMRNQGDLLIDEVHHELWIKNKLNYSIGTCIEPKTRVLKDCIALFQFLKHVPYQEGGLTLEGILKKNQLLTKPEQFQEACELLADTLVDNSKSPVYSLIQEAKERYPDLESDLKRYLKSQGQQIPNYILEAPKEVQSTFALYKHQVSRLLPYTLKRKHGEHYGPSRSEERSQDSKAVSIPYLANNTPNERSRFGNFLEETNYTIQSLMISGLSKDLFAFYITSILMDAKKELLHSQCTSLDQTQIAQAFQTLLDQHQVNKTLSKIDVTNQGLMQTLYNKLANDPTVIFQALERNVLKNMKIETSILHSNTINRVDEVFSCQAVDGTPNNHTTYHQRLVFEAQAAKGLDEYIAWGIRSKNPAIIGLEFESTETFVQQLLTPPRCTPNLRALIDISATFKGQEALHVVECIAKNLKTAALPIKYILFFNADNILCAYDPLQTTSQTPIEIGSSDPTSIQQTLNCTPDACFTYYDQSHCVGSDIRQSNEAEALVLIDNDTQKQHFLQGSMRMRKLLDGNQRINLVVPPSIADENFDTLLERMTENEVSQLKQENYQAALAKMDGVIRNDLMERILAVEGDNSAQFKSELFEQWRGYFIEEKVIDIFQLYGGLNELKDTSEVLTKYQTALFDNWKKNVNNLSAEEIKNVQEKLNKILSTALQDNACFPKQICPTEELSTHVEVQQEIQKELQKELQREIQQENLGQNLIPEKYIPWPENAIADLQQITYLHIKSLTEICSSNPMEITAPTSYPAGEGSPESSTMPQSDDPSQARDDVVQEQLPKKKYTPEFSPTIIATTNFYQTYTTQSRSLDSFLKPVHGLLFTKNPLRCVILSQQELKDISKTLPENAWITTTQNTLLAGTFPEGISEDQTYRSILEQVQYFNGECPLLIENYRNLSWLRTDTESKLSYLKDTLSNMHEMNLSEFERLECLMTQPIDNDDIATPSEVAQPVPIASPVDMENTQTSVNKLAQLCEEYMDYALKKMNIPFEATQGYPSNVSIFKNSKKMNLLAEKYHYIKSLYDTTQSSENPAKVLKSLKSKLMRGEFDLLTTHRDSLFVRILTKMRDILLYRVPFNQFFKLKSAKSETVGNKMKAIFLPPSKGN